ncbi:MAG: branched-chain amino acid ABC transporter permease [Candidatus Nezhaarchaeales archaeon]
MLDALIYGLINGLILALITAGFTLCYSVSRLPNFAHGALYILAGLVAWTLFNSLGLNYVLSVFCSLISTAFIGAAIYWLLVMRVRGMEASEIIVTFAVALLMMEVLRYLGFVGPKFTLPVFVSGSIDILGVTVDYHRWVIVALTAALMLFLWFFTHNTKVGLALRAIAQDERAAMMLGIDSDLVASLSLAFGSALAALAAIIVLPLGAITVETGYSVLIMAVAVAILGGLGSMGGTFIAALLLGFSQQFAMKLVGPQYSMVVFMAAIVLVLIIKPSGIFGKTKELEERV